ncbi:gamma-glutamyltranspeptidase [Paenibacillus swuensis]|uniref:Glutathione hydrolase proenzyme n=1 Tax=Paenibacillus swuensis TaxID=1178515 RepID=A0A172TKR1_9BACL|nr:gamma-glutamyltransferase [Paenibacillus swuensis]ANE47645.1 gamma-glutamyltranspeptidase [Paenibacillus swuensis]
MHNVTLKSYQAMVTSPHYMATAVGSAILQEGGNAFDAAVAISAALAVTYPHMTGLGGDAFFLMYSAETGMYTAYNGSGRSGAQLNRDYYTNRGLTSIPQRGIDSAITVPGMVDAWHAVSERYGSVSWEKLLEPAVRYAKQGIPVSRNLEHWITRSSEALHADPKLNGLYYPQGRPLKEGDRLIQADLAATLTVIQAEGRETFYTGKIMQSITQAIQNDKGLLTSEDFISHQGEWVVPLSTSYRDYELYQLPPNSQGFSALMMMNMLEHINLSQIPRESALYYHLMTEVTKRAFADRDAYLTDPGFRNIPLEMLLSKSYALQQLNSIRLEAPQAASFMSPAMGQDTAYAAVMDSQGNAVSFIQSLYYDFGSAYSAGSTGVVMQNRGSFFSLDASHPNVLEPGKRSFHTLMPAMASRNGKPYLLYGTQGGEGQPQTQLSIVTAVLDYGLNIDEAIRKPRWVYGRTWGDSGDTLKLEGRIPEEITQELATWGHAVERVGNWDGMMGQSQGIQVSSDGAMIGAADPRGDGSVIGW